MIPDTRMNALAFPHASFCTINFWSFWNSLELGGFDQSTLIRRVWLRLHGNSKEKSDCKKAHETRAYVRESEREIKNARPRKAANGTGNGDMRGHPPAEIMLRVKGFTETESSAKQAFLVDLWRKFSLGVFIAMAGADGSTLDCSRAHSC